MRAALLHGAVALLFAASSASASAQDIQAGKRAFHTCSPCHDVGKGAKIKLGPPLNGIAGRKVATYPGYHYSKAARQSSVVWTEKTFTAFIHRPRDVIPGTRMVLIGARSDKTIAELWAYLSQFDITGAKKPH